MWFISPETRPIDVQGSKHDFSKIPKLVKKHASAISPITKVANFLKQAVDRKLDGESNSFFKIVLSSISVEISLLKVKNR